MEVAVISGVIKQKNGSGLCISRYSVFNDTDRIGGTKSFFGTSIVHTHLHVGHGLLQLLQLMGGAKRLQTDVRQLALFLP